MFSIQKADRISLLPTYALSQINYVKTIPDDDNFINLRTVRPGAHRVRRRARQYAIVASPSIGPLGSGHVNYYRLRSSDFCPEEEFSRLKTLVTVHEGESIKSGPILEATWQTNNQPRKRGGPRKQLYHHLPYSSSRQRRKSLIDSQRAIVVMIPSRPNSEPIQANPESTLRKPSATPQPVDPRTIAKSRLAIEAQPPS